MENRSHDRPRIRPIQHPDRHPSDLASSPALLAGALLAGALLAASGAAHPARAQAETTFDLRGGVSVPVGATADAADPGAAWGFGLAIPLHARVHAVVGADLELLRGRDDGEVFVPDDVTLFRYHVSLAVRVTPDESPLRVRLLAGGGGLLLRAEPLEGGVGQVEQNGTMGLGGVDAAWRVLPWLRVGGSVRFARGGLDFSDLGSPPLIPSDLESPTTIPIQLQVQLFGG